MKARIFTSQTSAPSLDRRTFLRAATTTLFATTLGQPVRPAAADTPEIRVRRRLGRTNLNISDISYGSSRTADAEVVRHALARGINYFDTAESYKGGAAEESLGVALAGHREEVIRPTPGGRRG